MRVKYSQTAPSGVSRCTVSFSNSLINRMFIQLSPLSGNGASACRQVKSLFTTSFRIPVKCAYIFRKSSDLTRSESCFERTEGQTRSETRSHGHSRQREQTSTMRSRLVGVSNRHSTSIDTIKVPLGSMFKMLSSVT